MADVDDEPTNDAFELNAPNALPFRRAPQGAPAPPAPPQGLPFRPAATNAPPDSSVDRRARNAGLPFMGSPGSPEMAPPPIAPPPSANLRSRQTMPLMPPGAPPQAPSGMPPGPPPPPMTGSHSLASLSAPPPMPHAQPPMAASAPPAPPPVHAPPPVQAPPAVAPPRWMPSASSGWSDARPAEAPGRPTHDARAALGGVSSASDAAATASPAPEARATSSVPMRARPGLSEYIDLLWFDERAPARVRQQAAWVDHLREAPRQSEWLTGEEPAGPPQTIRDRRDVTRAMARVPPSDATAITRAMEEAIDEDGIFVRPLVVVNGELTMTFDPLEVLRTTIAVASQLAMTDKKLKETVDAASEIAEAPRMTPGPLVDGSIARLRQAFAQANRSLPSDYLEASVQRLLLEERRYQRRTLLGGARLCGLLAHGGHGAPLPTYLPEHLASELPLFPRFRVRALAEPHAQQDPLETEPIALLVLAIGRSVPMAGARSGRAS